MANSVDPDETVRYEPSHQDLHCLQRYLYWFVGMRVLTLILNRKDNLLSILQLYIIYLDKEVNAFRMKQNPPIYRITMKTSPQNFLSVIRDNILLLYIPVNVFICRYTIN